VHIDRIDPCKRRWRSNFDPLLMRLARQVVMTALLVLKEDVTDKMVRY
jgi:hypothetical protein